MNWNFRNSRSICKFDCRFYFVEIFYFLKRDQILRHKISPPPFSKVINKKTFSIFNLIRHSPSQIRLANITHTDRIIKEVLRKFVYNLKCLKLKRRISAFCFLMFCWLCVSVYFILAINQLDAQKICCAISFFHASTCFEHHVLIVRRSKLCYTNSGIITPVGGHPVHRLCTGCLSTCAPDGHP